MDLNSEFALELCFNKHSLVIIFSIDTWARTPREDQGRQGSIITKQGLFIYLGTVEQFDPLLGREKAARLRWRYMKDEVNHRQNITGGFQQWWIGLLTEEEA